MNGNLGAQETLYNKYKKIIKDFLRSKYSNYYDIDDDVSEITIKVFLSLKSYDESKSKFKSWVLSICKNYMIDKWRNNINNTLIVNNNFSYEIADTGLVLQNVTNSGNANCFDGDITYSNNTGTVLISDSISFTNTLDFDNCNSITYLSSQLSPADYAILDMKYLQGYNYCEIAQEFNLTSTTVSNRVNYVKTKLKKNNCNINY